MHARRLVEIAGTVSLTAPPSLSAGEAIASDALAEYWIASRCRLDGWGRALRRLGHTQSLSPHLESGDLLMRLVEEITLAEVLARVVTGVAILSDRARECEDAAVIAVNALEGHLEAKRRTRLLTSAWWPADSPRSRHTEALRRRAGAWSDNLLGRLGAGFDWLAADRSRLADSRRDTRGDHPAAERLVRRLTLASLREAFADASNAPVAADLNSRVGGAALGLIGKHAFDSHGLPRPAWMLRAERIAEETAGLLRFAADEPYNASHTELDPTSSRWWM